MLSPDAKMSFAQLVPDDWVVTRQSLKSGGFTIEHHMEEPSVLTTPGLAQHALLITLSQGNQRQVTRIGDESYEGENPVGGFWLASAHTSAEWVWETVDETIAFVIEPAHLQMVAAETECLNPSSVELQNVAFGRDPQLAFLAQCSRQELIRREVGDRLYTDSLATLISLHLLRNYCTHDPAIHAPVGKMGRKRLGRVLDYIDAHLDQSLGLADLAAIAQMSQYHFSTTFKMAMGMPPYRYVLQQRTQRAKQLLKDESITISEVALRCGFADQSHMTKHFSKLVGISPKRYRDTLRD